MVGPPTSDEPHVGATPRSRWVSHGHVCRRGLPMSD
jgi:hypothetical protein